MLWLVDWKSYILELLCRKKLLDRDIAWRGGCRERFRSRMKPSNKSLSLQVKYRFVFMLAVLQILINLSLICNRYYFLHKPEFCPWGLPEIEHVKVSFLIFCFLCLSINICFSFYHKLGGTFLCFCSFNFISVVSY